MQYVRYVVEVPGRDPSLPKRGLFAHMSGLVQSGALDEGEMTQWAEWRVWFMDHYRMPSVDEIAHRGDPLASRFWFKAAVVSDELAAKTADVVAFLRRRGETVTVLRTDDPGFVTYEDHLQVAAEPY